jgi:hypothetical protein
MAQRRFAVEKGLTNSGVHELLIYRRTDDPTKCFQFQHKRTTNDGPSYICMGCSFYYKSLSKEERDFSVNSISVSNNLAYFLSDPEALNHGCIRSEKYTYGYECKKVEQLRKLVLFFMRNNLYFTEKWYETLKRTEQSRVLRKNN